MSLWRYIFKRLLAVLPVLFLLPLLTLVLMQMVPGNYFDTLRLNPQIAPETIRQYEDMYHLNEPVFIQYFYWLRNILKLDFGYSFTYKQPVLSILFSRFLNTVLLTGTSFVLAWFLAVLTGLWSGVHKGGWIDRLLSGFVYAGLSFPNFFLCLILLWGAAEYTGLPLGGIRSVHHDAFSLWGKLTDVALHMVIPVTVLAIGSYSYLFRLMKAQTLEVAQKDFVFYLRAMRISERRIVYRHIGRNAINPLITLLGMELPALFSGAALVEIFTGWPGLGQMMLQAVRSQDLFLVLGNMFFIGFLLVAGNLLADILLVAVDPRIRLEAPS